MFPSTSPASNPPLSRVTEAPPGDSHWGKVLVVCRVVCRACVSPPLASRSSPAEAQQPDRRGRARRASGASGTAGPSRPAEPRQPWGFGAPLWPPPWTAGSSLAGQPGRALLAPSCPLEQPFWTLSEELYRKGDLPLLLVSRSTEL